LKEFDVLISLKIIKKRLSFFKVQTNFPSDVPRTGSGYKISKIWKENPLTRNSLIIGYVLLQNLETWVEVAVDGHRLTIPARTRPA
jgi:hypothetical protein